MRARGPLPHMLHTFGLQSIAHEIVGSAMILNAGRDCRPGSYADNMHGPLQILERLFSLRFGIYTVSTCPELKIF